MNATAITTGASSNDRTKLEATRALRRRRNKIRRLHHHAVRTDDMEATRRFYEDLLGMPMVAALKASLDHGTGGEEPFLHCFFEMGDGSCLAFFQFLPNAYGLLASCRKTESIITSRYQFPSSTILWVSKQSLTNSGIRIAGSIMASTIRYTCGTRTGCS